MKTMNIWPAVRYHLEYVFWALLWTFGIVGAISVAIHIFFGAITTTGNVDVNILGFVLFSSTERPEMIAMLNLGALAMFMFFIFGIAGIREDLRFYLQHGMGRRTTYWSFVVGALISGAVVGLLGEALNLAFRFWPAFPLSGLNFNPVSGFFIGWVLHIGFFFFAWQFGALLSLIYYRLSKNQQIIFTVAAIATFVIILPRAAASLLPSADVIATAVYSFLSSPLNWIVIIFSLCAGTALGNFLLLRRANVKE